MIWLLWPFKTEQTKDKKEWVTDSHPFFFNSFEDKKSVGGGRKFSSAHIHTQ